MDQRSIANGMVPLLMLIDELNMETLLQIKDRRQTKHAVYVAEGKRGDQILHVAQWHQALLVNQLQVQLQVQWPLQLQIQWPLQLQIRWPLQLQIQLQVQ